MKTVQVKLRFMGESVKWEDRKIHTEFDVISNGNGYFVDLKNHQIRLSEAVQGIAEQAGAVESRWNFKDSNQGHYSFVFSKSIA